MYDDYFEIVLLSPEQEPDSWEEIVIFQSFRLSLEEDDKFFNYELRPEWITEEELLERDITWLPGLVTSIQREPDTRTR